MQNDNSPMTTESTDLGLHTNYELLWDQVEVSKGISWKFGCKALTKLIEFLDKYEFTLTDFQHYQSLKPARESNEEFETYRIRRKFCDVLSKYRNETKTYIVQKAVLKSMNQVKEQKEQFEQSI